MSHRKGDSDVIPAPEAPADASEQLRAERLGDHVTTLVADERLPPAMDPDDRMLLDVASMIRAGMGEVSLREERARELTTEALARATEPGGERAAADHATIDQVTASKSNNDELGAQRQRRSSRRWVPWTVAVVASAAALMLWYTRPARDNSQLAQIAPTQQQVLPAIERSRPADPQIGAIPRAEAGAAATRLDAIYANRMSGYRSLRFKARVRGGTRD